MEMLAYAAARCPWKEDAQQLRRGGELLNHVCFLTLHLGLSEQYEHNSFKDYNSLNDYIRGHVLVLPWVSLPKTFLKYIISIDYHILIFVSKKTME
ncbi:hypothetical protein NC652_035375 [Populus alba x Populus x berolinensis]|nr:hypothetical protein NC652_035375 [Populus alba x Populus x berolinensis]